MAQKSQFDVIIIGGGFYGASLALALKKYFRTIVVLEKESDLLTQASYVNQATIHNGYHYPRSHLTALRSRANFPAFAKEFAEATYTDYERVYAVAHNNSKVSAFQFRAFCERINIPVTEAPKSVRDLFDDRMIETAFVVQEYAFYADRLRDILKERLAKAQITVQYDTQVDKVSEDGGHLVVQSDKGQVTSERVISCVYANTNVLLQNSGLDPLPLKHEMTEVALISVPPALKKIGLTVIDGPFFATMPFPMTPYHSFTHVRYTPQKTFQTGEDFARHTPQSSFRLMINDAARYLPLMSEAKYQTSLFTVKTVLPQNEWDDGRPILYRKNYGFKNFSVVLGGKIDNIYDIFSAMKL